MVKNHLKALNTPRTWNVARKKTVFVMRPHPGAHSLEHGFSIQHVLINEIKLCSVSKEVKLILNNNECLVNGKAVKNAHYIVGFMDAISFPKINKHYRITMNEKGKLCLIGIDKKEANLKLCKIINKVLLKGGKIQLNSLDGRNFLVAKDECKTTSSILIEVPSQKIIKTIPFEKGSMIMLVGGKHIGVVATVEKIESGKIFITKENKTYQTSKKHVFVLGKAKPEIKMKD